MLLLMPVLGLAIAGLAIGFGEATDNPSRTSSSPARIALGGLISNAPDWSVGALLLLVACKSIAYALSLSASAAARCSPPCSSARPPGSPPRTSPGSTLIPAAAMGIGAMCTVMLTLPLTSTLLATLLLGSDGLQVMPVVIVAVVIAYVVTARLTPAAVGGADLPPPRRPPQGRGAARSRFAEGWEPGPGGGCSRGVRELLVEEAPVRRVLIAVPLAIVLLIAPAAYAGGWATVGLSSTPAGTEPGTPWPVEITVLQHGVTPLEGVEPAVIITSGDARETFAATPTGKPGVYRAKVVFPTAGRWSYAVDDGFISGARTRSRRCRSTPRRPRPRRRPATTAAARPPAGSCPASRCCSRPRPCSRATAGATTIRRRRESHHPRRRRPRLCGGGDDDRRLRRRRLGLARRRPDTRHRGRGTA